MISRNLYRNLQEWKNSISRLPLILRGARQVGKTTLINQFGKEYDQYLYFNLEKKKDKDLFNKIEDLENTLQLLFISKGMVNSKRIPTLLFIDEVQEEPKVIESLRFFHEEHAHIHVIVTGSLIDFALNKITKTPVGRVEYAVLRPLNFVEFIGGTQNQVLKNKLLEIPVNNKFIDLLYQHFHEFALVGGMPNMVNNYFIEKDLSRILNLYSSIINAYKDDVEKYAKNNTQKLILRHIMETAPLEIDNRVNLNNFGNSSFKTREVKEAMLNLTKAGLVQLVYPTTNTAPPIIPNYRKHPRLHFLDIGLVNYQLGLHNELLSLNDLHESSKGKLIQQIVNQEILSQSHLPDQHLSFWVREERGTSSEVDIVIGYLNMIIPIEIKSGATGRLKSLHEFMDRCDHQYAIRIYSGSLSIDQITTNKGKFYYLLNLPYLLSCQIHKYIEWFIQIINSDRSSDFFTH